MQSSLFPFLPEVEVVRDENSLAARIDNSGLTRTLLAQLSGVSEREIYRILSGQVKTPRQDTEKALLHVLSRRRGGR